MTMVSEPAREQKRFPVTENDIRNFISLNLEIGHLAGRVSSLLRENENAIRELTGFYNTTFFKSEERALRFLSDYYKKKAPGKKVLYLGFPQKISPPNFSFIYQLRGAKSFITERFGDVAALILDPLWMIQKSHDYTQRIYSLRALCSGSAIPFILDERKSLAHVHQKGLNFVFQFGANAVLLGENLSNGICLGALAHPPDFFDEIALPGTSAPKAESLLACKKITEELMYAHQRFYAQWNIQGNTIAAEINKKLKEKYPQGLINNFGSILWLNHFGCTRAQKKLHYHHVLQGSEQCIYLPPDLSPEEKNEFIQKIVSILTKRKTRSAKAKQVKKNRINKNPYNAPSAISRSASLISSMVMDGTEPAAMLKLTVPK